MSRLHDITSAEEESFELEFIENIKAGFPSPSADRTGERIDIVKEMTSHPETTFYARVDGDSMRDMGILDGDIVVIDRSLEPRDGDVIAAFIDQEFTIKEFRHDPTHRCGWLIPHNPQFKPIQVTAENNFGIWGVVTHAVHSLRYKKRND